MFEVGSHKAKSSDCLAGAVLQISQDTHSNARSGREPLIRSGNNSSSSNMSNKRGNGNETTGDREKH